MILRIIWASIARTLSGFQGSLVMRFQGFELRFTRPLDFRGFTHEDSMVWCTYSKFQGV